MHLRGVPWVRIGEQVGQIDLAVTANTYSHVILDEGELDYAALTGFEPRVRDDDARFSRGANRGATSEHYATSPAHLTRITMRIRL